MVVVVVVDGANVGAVTTVVLLLLLLEFLVAATPIPTQHTIDTMIKQIVPMVIPIAIPTELLLPEDVNVGAGTYDLEQTMPTSSLWKQSCLPVKLPEHEESLDSYPEHLTSSTHIDWEGDPGVT